MDGLTAVTAFPAQHQPADQRDVVVGADLRPAVRAMGAPLADLLAVRQAPRPSVEEAADEEAVDDGHDDQQRRHAGRVTCSP